MLELPFLPEPPSQAAPQHAAGGRVAAELYTVTVCRLLCLFLQPIQLVVTDPVTTPNISNFQ